MGTGDSLNELSDSLRRLGSIRWMHTRHEEVAAFAAGSEAAETGELAVCAGSCGPGNFHVINGLFDCHRNHAPVLAIAAQIPSTEIGFAYLQETQQQELCKECSHFVELVPNASQFPRVLEWAMRTAIEERRVALSPSVLNVVTNRHALALPPKVEWAHAKGFSLHLLRAVLNGRGDEVIELTQTNLLR